MSEHEQLIALARRAQPSAQPDTDLRRMARRAVATAAARRFRVRRRVQLALAVSVCSAGLLLASSSALRTSLREGLGGFLSPAVAPSSSVQGPPLEVALPTGDRLVATAGAQFQLLRSEPAARELALREGAIVFAIEPLRAGERFVVRTPHLEVAVRGTVFSVEVDSVRSRVRVHEGAVSVRSRPAASSDEMAERTLAAGERFGSDGAEVPELLQPQLATRAGELAAERALAEPASTALENSPERAVALAAPDAGPGGEPPSAPRTTKAASRDDTLERARAYLHAGDAQAALELARTVLSHDGSLNGVVQSNGGAAHGAWRVLEGDALRALGEPRAAAAAYETAYRSLSGQARALAAFKAADVCLRMLDDPSASLRVLQDAALDAETSPLRERALLLRIEAMSRLDLPLREHALRYLELYPDSAGAARMRALLSEPAPTAR